ncbi:MAG: helix-turn-helix domain-containing protein [Bacteroidales bacterium]|nr:helix-turn-helix domain-containing protein [Bacteroidales bacterium]
MRILKQLKLHARTRRLYVADEKTREGLERWLREKKHTIPSTGMEDVAEEIGVSSLQLSYYFRVVVGEPFLSWRKEKRILDAQALLVKYPEKSIAAIGEAVGIPDKSNFKKQFKSVTGMSPKDFREKYAVSGSQTSRSR